jgi:DNA-binding IclR family transcriptional regulator
MQFLLAPVMDKHGQVAFLLALSGFSGSFRDTQVKEVGTRLMQACSRITSFIVGKHAIIQPSAGD